MELAGQQGWIKASRSNEASMPTLCFQACKVVLVDLERLQCRRLLQICSVHSAVVMRSTIATLPPVLTLQQHSFTSY